MLLRFVFFSLLGIGGAALTGCAGGHCSGKQGVAPSICQFKKLCFKTCGDSPGGYKVYRTPRDGPPILLLHELNGLSPATLDVALELAQKHWTVYSPLLFGCYGDDDALGAMKGLKHNARWDLTNPRDSGPILGDLEAMTKWISLQHDGARVVVMGSCLTGALPLALLALPEVKAAVMCQPALPLPTTALGYLTGRSCDEKRLMGLPLEKVGHALDAMEKDHSKSLLGFHYLADPVAPFARFDWIHDEMLMRGMEARFRPVVLVPPNSNRNEDWWQSLTTRSRRNLIGPHSTVTSSKDQDDLRRLRASLSQQLEPLRRSH